GGGTYLWSNGQTSASITVIPTATSVYTLTVTNSFGCKTDTTYRVNVTTPDGLLTGPSKLCLGSSISLVASGGITYLWSTGATSNSISVSPTTNMTYTVIVNNGCIDTLSTTVFLDTLVLYACCDTAISIPGSSVSLRASGSTNYY